MKVKEIKAILALKGETNWKVEEAKKGKLKTGTGREIPAYTFQVSLELPSLKGGKRKKVENLILFRREDGYELYCYCGKKICEHKKAVANYLAEHPNLIEDEEISRPTVESKDETLKDFHPLIRFAIKHHKPLLLAGPTGSGKTHTVLKLVEALKNQGKVNTFYQINLSGGVEDIDLLGKIIPTGNGKWTVVDGELTKALKDAMEGKKVFVLLEELTRASQSARNLILKAIDTVGKIVVNNFLTGETYRINPENIQFVATANLGYVDTDEIDLALRRRFIIFFKDYDEKAEKEILLKMGYTPEAIDVIMAFTKSLRNLVKAEGLAPFDTGSLKDFAELLKEDKETALEFLKWKLPQWEESEPLEEHLEIIENLFKEFFH